MSTQSKSIVEILKLESHPEGGYFRETYRSNEVADKDSLPARFTGSRNFSTGIYFLLEGSQTSKFHKIKSDEMWHHYSGCTILIHVIDESGKYSVIRLGKDLEKAEQPQAVVPAGMWFGASLEDKSSFALAGCTVSPGFDFLDFELAERELLLDMYPDLKEIITKLT